MTDFDFDSDQQAEKRRSLQQADQHYIKLQALKKRRTITAIAGFLGMLALIGLLIALRQKAAEQAVRDEFNQTVSGEIEAIRAGDKGAFLGYQQNTQPWAGIQWDAFDEYRQAKGRIVAGNQVVESQSDGAHGHVVLEELVDGKPYRVTWFYDYGEDGWKHVPPPAAYWGAAQHVSGDHFDIDYLSLDADQVSAMETQLDEWWQTACQLTACGSGGPDQISVHVSFDLLLSPRWSPDDPAILEIPSPHLRRVPADGALDPAFKGVLARLLAEHWARWAAPIPEGASVDAAWLHDELATWLAHAMGADPTTPLFGPLEGRGGPQAVMTLVRKVRGGEGAIPALGEVSGIDPLDPTFGWQAYLATQLQAEAALAASGKTADAARLYGDPDHPWQNGDLPPMSPGSIQVSSVAWSGDISWAEVTFSPPEGDEDAPVLSMYAPFRVVDGRWAHSSALPADFGAMQDLHSAHVTLHVPSLEVPLTDGLIDDLEKSFTKAESDLGIAPGEIGGLEVTVAPQAVIDDPLDGQTPLAAKDGGTPAALAIAIESPHLAFRPTALSAREAALGQAVRNMLIEMIRYRALTVNPRSPLSMAIARWELAQQGLDADTFLPVTAALSGEGIGSPERVWLRSQTGPFVQEDMLGARVLIDMMVQDHGPQAVGALLAHLADAKDIDDWLSKSLNVRVTDIRTRWVSATQTAVSLAGGQVVPSTTSAESQALQGSSDGPIDVMMSDSGKTITLKVGQSFRLHLNPNPDVTWSVEVGDPSMIVLTHQINAPTGAQWTYVASKAGRTSLTARPGTTYICTYNRGVVCMTDEAMLQWEIIVN